MTHADEERLARYFDGELTTSEREEVERWLEGAPEGRAHLRTLEAIGDAVRAAEAGFRDRAPDLTDAILARVERDGAGRRETAAESPLARGPARPAPGVRWLRLLPPVGLALAAAAAVALLLRPPGTETGAGEGGPIAALSTVSSSAPATAGPVAEEAPSGSGAEPGAAIESVDFGAHNGTIFMVAGAGDVTPVVWLVDEPDPGGARMAPL